MELAFEVPEDSQVSDTEIIVQNSVYYTTFGMFYSTKILRCLYNMLPRPAWEIGLTAVWLTGCVVYLSLKAVVIGDVVDCPDVPVRFLKSVLTHHVITVTCFVLRMEISTASVGDLVAVPVTGVGLQNTGNLVWCLVGGR